MAKFNYNFGALKNGIIEYAPNPIEEENGIIWTNDSAVYLEHGYKRIVSTQAPIKEGCYHTFEWVEHETSIEQVWIEHEERAV